MYTNSKIGLAESDGVIWDSIESLEGANLAQKLLLAVFLYSRFLSTSPLSFFYTLTLNPSPFGSRTRVCVSFTRGFLTSYCVLDLGASIRLSNIRGTRDDVFPPSSFLEIQR